MTNGTFKPLDDCAYSRAINVMSTESAIDFEWSVRIDSTENFIVGIASEFKQEMEVINLYDQNAIIYSNQINSIRIGSKTIYSELTEHRTGDVVCFRFLSHLKKLVIYLVRKFPITKPTLLLINKLTILRMDVTK